MLYKQQDNNLHSLHAGLENFLCMVRVSVEQRPLGSDSKQCGMHTSLEHLEALELILVEVQDATNFQCHCPHTSLSPAGRHAPAFEQPVCSLLHQPAYNTHNTNRHGLEGAPSPYMLLLMYTVYAARVQHILLYH